MSKGEVSLPISTMISFIDGRREEFETHKLSNVQVEHRNVCKNGFADARDVQGGELRLDVSVSLVLIIKVFLDLPAPWEAIPHAIETFRVRSRRVRCPVTNEQKDGIARICCFSPCLEQVLKTVSSLRKNGFEGEMTRERNESQAYHQDITTQEVLIRTHEIVAPPAPNATPPLRSVSSIVSDLQAREAKKQERRILQMKTAREKSRLKKLAEAGAEAASSTRTGDEDGAAAKSGAAEASDSLDTTETHLEGSSSKSDNVFGTKRKSEEVEDVHEQADSVAGLEDSTAERSHANPLWTEPETNLRNVVLTRPSAEMRGHTSYLTFATFYPETIRQQLAAMVEVPTGVSTPVGKRVEELVGGAREDRAASQDTDYGSEGIDEVMGTLTEEDMMGMGA